LIFDFKRCRTLVRHRVDSLWAKTVSGSISPASTAYFSPFPHGTGSLSDISGI